MNNLKEEVKNLRAIVSCTPKLDMGVEKSLNKAFFYIVITLTLVVMFATFLTLKTVSKEVIAIREALAPFELIIDQNSYDQNKGQ